MLEHGGLLIDMPGMRELGMMGVSEGIDESFADIRQLLQNCRFSDYLTPMANRVAPSKKAIKAPRTQVRSIIRIT